MLIKTLDGRTIKWKLDAAQQGKISQLHQKAISLIQEVFPLSLILEEIQIEIKRNKYLYLDIYLPLFKLAVEVDGQQHDKYNNFLNKNPINFLKQKKNDKLKEQWCELNNITLIRLKHDESESDWKYKLGTKTTRENNTTT